MITINGQDFDYQDIQRFCKQPEFSTHPDWYKHIFLFILEYVENSKFLVHTSGSTGHPKEIEISKQQMNASAQMTIDYFGLQPGKTALHCLPTKFIGGKMMIVRAIVGKLNLIPVEPNINPLEQLKFPHVLNFAAMTPMQVEMSLRHYEKAYEKIENVIIGGAGIPSSLEEKLVRCSNNNFSTFGMTETVSHIALREIDQINSNYKALDGVTISTSHDSCLKISAPHLISEEITTNDIVELIDDRKFIWKGRKDNVINSGGLKIHPELLEKKLQLLVDDPFMIGGIPDQLLGEKVIMIIEGILSPSEKSMLLHEVASIISGPEKPREIYCVDKLSYAGQGKIDRRNSLLKILD